MIKKLSLLNNEMMHICLIYWTLVAHKSIFCLFIVVRTCQNMFQLCERAGSIVVKLKAIETESSVME